MNYIYWLSQIQHSEKSLVGNQLYILSQLLQRENPILPGFVLGKSLQRQFFIDSKFFRQVRKDLADNSSGIEDYQTLQSIARHSREIFARTTFPKLRETEIFQAAQQLNTNGLILQPFLFSPSGKDFSSRGFWQFHTCNLHPQAIIQTIKEIYSELFNAKSLIYFHKLGLAKANINSSILIRPSIDVCASGSVEIGADYLVIKAIWGQERGLTLGDVDKDIYFLETATGSILSRTLGHKNYGYRLREINTDLPHRDCLESYIPQESQTEIAVLEPEAIADLFRLIKNVLAQQPQIKYLQWIATIPTAGSDNALNYFFTQFSDRLTTFTHFPPPETDSILASTIASQALLTGVAAAPGKVIGRTTIVDSSENLPASLPEDTILVAQNITPHYLPLIKSVKGIITEIGGTNSHGAIIARELNIPAIVGAADACKILSNSQEVLLNGDDGNAYPRSVLQYLSWFDFPQPHLATQQQLIATKLMVNISQLESIPQCLNLPIDGVGLLRSEMMLGQILSGTTPEQWQSATWQEKFGQTLKKYLLQFVRAFAPRPVFYRSLDLAATDLEKGFLGNRGTYSYRLDSTLFNLELDAIAETIREGNSNLNLILPFVRSVEEFHFCDRQIKAAGLKERKSFRVWIMAEVPSVIYLLPEYIAAGVQGIAIGTNDLTQLLLGVNRELDRFHRNGLNANHEVVRQAISEIVKIAKDNQIDCSICGQAPVEYPEMIEKLVAWGITSISVEPKAVLRTHNAIARAEKKILLNSLNFHQER